MRLRGLKNAPIYRGTRVLLRADFDVVIKNGKIEDDFRIQRTLPTIRYLLSRGARLLILTKRGHFKMKRSRALSTKVLIPHLERLCGEKVHFIANLRGLNFFSSYDKFDPSIFLFENLRFWPEEEANKSSFAKQFARVADVYVSDNFGTAHRTHASVAGIPQFLSSYAGFLVESEVEALERVIKNQERPVVVVLGGAKLETKLPLIERFIKLGSEALVGGTLANTLFSARGIEVGKSVVDEKFVERVRYLKSKRLHLPVDVCVAHVATGRVRVASVNNVLRDESIFDVGPDTIKLFDSIIKRAKTIVWNGPMGFAEVAKFSRGTKAVARAIQMSHAFSIVGGGDTLAILKKYKLLGRFNHVSTGGGAMLEFLAGKKLPGIEALKR